MKVLLIIIILNVLDILCFFKLPYDLMKLWYSKLPLGAVFVYLYWRLSK